MRHVGFEVSTRGGKDLRLSLPLREVALFADGERETDGPPAIHLLLRIVAEAGRRARVHEG